MTTISTLFADPATELTHKATVKHNADWSGEATLIIEKIGDPRAFKMVTPMPGVLLRDIARLIVKRGAK